VKNLLSIFYSKQALTIIVGNLCWESSTTDSHGFTRINTDRNGLLSREAGQAKITKGNVLAAKEHERVQRRIPRTDSEFYPAKWDKRGNEGVCSGREKAPVILGADGTAPSFGLVSNSVRSGIFVDPRPQEHSFAPSATKLGGWRWRHLAQHCSSIITSPTGRSRTRVLAKNRSFKGSEASRSESGAPAFSIPDSGRTFGVKLRHAARGYENAAERFASGLAVGSNSSFNEGQFGTITNYGIGSPLIKVLMKTRKTVTLGPPAGTRPPAQRLVRASGRNAHSFQSAVPWQ
jgi:hypothetical protein